MTFGTLIMCFISTLASNHGGNNLRTDSKDPNNKFTVKTWIKMILYKFLILVNKNIF